MSGYALRMLLWLPLLAACSAPSTVRETGSRYLAALAAGQLEEAFDLLSRASRTRLASAEEAWRAGRPDPLIPRTPPPEARAPGQALFEVRMAGADGTALPPLPEDPSGLIAGVVEDGERARISLHTPLGLRTLKLVREDGDWRIDLDLER